MSSDKLRELADIAQEIQNLSHSAWLDRPNAEYLFREIERRALLIKQSAALLAESAPGAQNEQLALPENVGDKFVIANGEQRFLAQTILELDRVPVAPSAPTEMP